MINTKYGYPAEKLSAARHILMAPHPRGEATGYAGAFHECMLGLKDLPPKELDDNARSWVETIERTMDATGIEDRSGRGTWTIKAEGLSIEEKQEFSDAVDQLAHWFDHRFRERE